MYVEPGKDFEMTQAIVNAWKVGLGVDNADIYYFVYSFYFCDLLYD